MQNVHFGGLFLHPTPSMYIGKEPSKPSSSPCGLVTLVWRTDLEKCGKHITSDYSPVHNLTKLGATVIPQYLPHYE